MANRRSGIPVEEGEEGFCITCRWEIWSGPGHVANEPNWAGVGWGCELILRTVQPVLRAKDHNWGDGESDEIWNCIS